MALLMFFVIDVDVDLIWLFIINEQLATVNKSVTLKLKLTNDWFSTEWLNGSNNDICGVELSII